MPIHSRRKEEKSAFDKSPFFLGSERDTGRRIATKKACSAETEGESRCTISGKSEERDAVSSPHLAATLQFSLPPHVSRAELVGRAFVRSVKCTTGKQTEREEVP